jgi:hypothetical protein
MGSVVNETQERSHLLFVSAFPRGVNRIRC